MALNTALIQQAKANREATMAGQTTVAQQQANRDNFATAAGVTAPKPQGTQGTSQALQGAKPLPSLQTSTVSPGDGSWINSRSSVQSTPAQTAEPTQQVPKQVVLEPQGQKPAQTKIQATEPSQGFDTGDKNINAQITQVQAQASNFDTEAQVVRNSQIDAEVTQRDALTQASDMRYQAEQENLRNQATIAGQARDALLTSIQGTSEVERADAKKTFDYATAQLENQKKLTDKAFEQRMVEQNITNHQNLLSQESRVAALGGFGNLTSMRELQFQTLNNDRMINELVYQKSAADTEITNQIVQQTTAYQNNLMKTSVDKQKAVSDTYNNYLSYVNDVVKNQELSEAEKYENIKTAQAAYTKNVAQINYDSLNKRYEIATNAAITSRQIYQQKIQNDRDNIEVQQFTDNQGNVTTVAVDKRTGEVVNQKTLAAIGASLAPQLTFDPYTGVGYMFDPATKTFMAYDGSTGAANYFNNVPAGYTKTGENYVANGDIKSIFNIGNKGVGDGTKNDGQCGHTYNYLTNGPKVGDTWDSKFNPTTLRPTVASGTDLDIRPGMGLAIPLLVKTDGSGTGHMETVLDYDKSTGVMHTVESNLDGKGTTATQTRNILDLEKAYTKPDGSAGFGFIPSTFKTSVQSKLDTSALPYTPPEVTGDQPQDLPGTNPSALKGLSSALANAVKQVVLGQYTKATSPYSQLSPGAAFQLDQAVQAYDPNYNELQRTANAQSLGSEYSTLAALQSSEKAAGASLDNLSSLHSKLPIPGKLTILNSILQKFEGGLSNPDVAAFRTASADALGQVGININSGNAVTQGLTATLEAGLPSGLSQEAFDRAITAIKNTMTNKVEGQRQVVQNLLTGKDISAPNSANTTGLATQIQTAKSHEYSSQDIVTQLSSDPSLSGKIKLATDAGYSPDDILNYLSPSQ